MDWMLEMKKRREGALVVGAKTENGLGKAPPTHAERIVHAPKKKERLALRWEVGTHAIVSKHGQGS